GRALRARGAPPMYTFDHLRHASPDELEQIYAGAASGEPPRGSYRGLVLHHMNNRGARRPLAVAADWLLFDAPPFGIDFDERRWWFLRPAWRVGRFTAAPGRSRWRDTDTLRLEYQVSRLPAPIRDLLYDEVKPL